ncbi:MAG: hypothetical protein CLLPBCKN_004510 [Chroococcidiopsis cubana SAG 39.79]|uniref:hypothetical protein n=1 Tax=Chroococcidiopsis cubana TaxID=171392 RepID=UPI002AC7AF94|nr:hypothetical protein [Chroococcidiopsis cubana]MDZ4875114.1 hypothetical protein [Chroococcidiopsis cubana SAG 39.79]
MHIDVPENIAAMPAAGTTSEYSWLRKTYASFHGINRAKQGQFLKLTILVLVGNGAIRANASEAVTEFATRLNIPVINTFMEKAYSLHPSFSFCGQ